jgi:hypothetical protein
VTNWDEYLTCTTCEAGQGEACYTLLGRGPEALPSRYADVPHSDRKRRGESRKPRAGSATATRNATPLPQRRAARKAATQTTGWAAVAERQRQRKETA